MINNPKIPSPMIFCKNSFCFSKNGNYLRNEMPLILIPCGHPVCGNCQEIEYNECPFCNTKVMSKKPHFDSIKTNYVSRDSNINLENHIDNLETKDFQVNPVLSQKYNFQTPNQFDIPNYYFHKQTSMKNPNFIKKDTDETSITEKYENKMKNMSKKMDEMVGMLKNLQQPFNAPDRGNIDFNISDNNMMNYMRYPADGVVFNNHRNPIENPSQIQYVYNEVFNPKTQNKIHFNSNPRIYVSHPESFPNNIHRKYQTPSTNSYYFKPTQNEDDYPPNQNLDYTFKREQNAEKNRGKYRYNFEKNNTEVLSSTLLRIIDKQYYIEDKLTKIEESNNKKFELLFQKIESLQQYLRNSREKKNFNTEDLTICQNLEGNSGSYSLKKSNIPK